MTSFACTMTTALLAIGLQTSGAQAQGADKPEKELIYTYISLWQVPRAKWSEFAKPVPGNQKILDQALADGSLVAYGDDFTLVHSAEGYTHDNWWISHSVAGVLKILDAFEKQPATTGGALASTTKHADELLVSRHYNWRAGTYKDAYTHGSSYKLKPTAPDDAVAVLSKSIFEPVLEKLLADGTIGEYEIDEENIHTEAPDSFWIFYTTTTAEGIDKTNAAIRESGRGNALIGPALDAWVDYTPHRDSLDRPNATFK